MSLINFTLKPPQEVDPAGREPDLSVSWFYLTDGDLWLNLGAATLYEYSDEVMRLWAGRPTRYGDYYVARFLEDFTKLFPAIAAPVPVSLYQLVRSYDALHHFKQKISTWMEGWPEEETPASATNGQVHDLLNSWISARTLYSSHLKGRPHLSFFRHDTKISLVWEADALHKNNLHYWTAGNGEIEIDFDAFVAAVEDFGHRFFAAMATQVQLAVDRDWGAVHLDKKHLVLEHQERKADFDHSLSLLKGSPALIEDWEETQRAVDEFTKRR